MQTNTLNPRVAAAAVSGRPGHRGVSYGRISTDTGNGEVKVTDQLEECAALAKLRDVDLIEECSDNDISANDDKETTLDGSARPGFLRVVELVRGGLVDYVVVWQMSRLLRHREQRSAFINLCGRMKVSIITVRGQDFNLGSASGRGLAGMLGEFDSMESEIKSERILAASLRRAKAGRPATRLGYGWNTEGKGASATFTINEDEAGVIREITRRVLLEDSIKGIVRDLNEAGVPAPLRDGGWIPSTVRLLALRPSNTALRVHHPGEADEQMFEGVWPAIVSRQDWERVCTILLDPSRTKNPGGNKGKTRLGSRKYMLSGGIGRCGICGSSVRHTKRVGSKRRKDGTPYAPVMMYACESPRGCTGRSREKLDAYVDLTIGELLARPDALAWALPSEDAARESAERVSILRKKLNDATVRWTDGRIDDDQFDTITSRLQPQIIAAEEDRRRHAASVDVTALLDLIGPGAEERWMQQPTERKIRMLMGLGIQVTIHPTTRGPKFRPEHITITARGRNVA